MSDKPHVFKLKLPNGFEVDIQGDKDFVSAGYGDFKTAAVELFNREAARTSVEDAAAKLMGEKTQAPEVQSTPAQALPAAGQSQAQPATQASRTKRKSGGKKAASPSSPAIQERKAKLETIRTTTFDDEDRYSAAINKSKGELLNLAALVVRLAQDKFGFSEGLSPAEIHFVLKERFYLNPNRRTLEKAMSDAPSAFFATRPAEFDGRAKLYRPMRDCIDRVTALLDEFNELRAAAAAASGTTNGIETGIN